MPYNVKQSKSMRRSTEFKGRVGLVYVSCDVAINGLASENGFVYIRCLLLNVYIRQCPLLCLSAFVLPGRRPQF